MGGGDLNLKKSWHPHTLKNQKRVYEAEQADAAEKKKLRELQQEIQNERNLEDLKRIGQNSGVLAIDNSKRLEWMYKGGESTLNREEYLTGRSIDKHFEEQDAKERDKEHVLVGVSVPKNHVEHECIPFSIRAFKSAPMNEDQVDLQRKIMEDPLMAIRQREMDARKKLLENPVKLKEIHRLLQEDRGLKKSKHGKKSKKKKSKKSKKKICSDSSESDNDLDALLAKKYKEVMGDNAIGNDNSNLNKILTEKYEKLSSELDKMHKDNKKSKKKKKSRSSDSSDSDESYKNKRHTNDNRKKFSNKHDDKKSKNPIRQDSFRQTYIDKKRYTGRSIESDRRNNRDRNYRRDRSRSFSPRRDTSTNRYRNRGEQRQYRRSRSRETSRRSSSRGRDRRSRSRSTGKGFIAREKTMSHVSAERGRKFRDQRSKSRERHQSNEIKRKSSSPSKRENRHDSHSPKKTKSINNSYDSKEQKRNIPGPSNVSKRSTSHDSSSCSSNSSSSNSSSSKNSNENKSECERMQLTSRNYGLVTAKGEKIELKSKIDLKSKSPIKMEPKKGIIAIVPTASRKPLTEKEKQERLDEMQKNAHWHTNQQNINRQKNKELAEQEKEQTLEFDSNYIHKEMHKALNNQHSVEARLKSNKNNIQRMSSSMQSHFTKK